MKGWGRERERCRRSQSAPTVTVSLNLDEIELKFIDKANLRLNVGLFKLKFKFIEA